VAGNGLDAGASDIKTFSGDVFIGRNIREDGAHPAFERGCIDGAHVVTLRDFISKLGNSLNA
jgi:hypothetical protein